MSAPWAVSATQVADWRLCPRKFLWKYVVGLRPSPGPGAELGTRVHDLLEKYLKGAPVLGPLGLARAPEWFILEPALEHLPRPGTCESEQKFRFEWRGVTWVGKIDVFEGAGVTPGWLGAGRVTDLKTTKEKKWVKSETELSTDPQALLYARFKKTREVKFVYALTHGKPRAVPVTAIVVGPGPVEDLLVSDALDIIDAVARAHHPLSVEPGPPEACEAFGGCPFRGVNCTDLRAHHGLGLGTRRAAASRDSGLIQLGRKKDDMGMKDMMAKIGQSLVPAQNPPVEDDQKVVAGVVHTSVGPGPIQIETESGVVVSSVNPPEQADAGPPPLPPPPKVGAKPRGRPKKNSEPKPAGEVAGTHPAPASTPAAEEPAPPALDASASAGGTAVFQGKLSIRTLYVNCASDAHPETVDLAKVMAEAHELTQQRHNVNHWYELNFNEGKASMAMFGLELLRTHPDCAAGTLRVRCSSYLPETALVLGELQAAAAEVVR